jgi:hypothetical protein
MGWMNEPASWEESEGLVAVDVEPDTDFWRRTHYGFIRDSGHFRFRRVRGDLEVRAEFRGDLAAQYDQVGLMLRADPETWVKCGVERVDGGDWLSVVLTRGHSDWSLRPAPPSPEGGWRTMEARFTAGVVEIGLVDDAGGVTPLRMGYLGETEEVAAGVMCAAPEGPGFRAEFRGFSLASEIRS